MSMHIKYKLYAKQPFIVTAFINSFQYSLNYMHTIFLFKIMLLFCKDAWSNGCYKCSFANSGIQKWNCNITVSILQYYCFYCISVQCICMPLAFNVYIFSVSLLEFILGLPFLQRTCHAAFDQNMLPFDSIIKFPDFCDVCSRLKVLSEWFCLTCSPLSDWHWYLLFANGTERLLPPAVAAPTCCPPEQSSSTLCTCTIRSVPPANTQTHINYYKTQTLLYSSTRSHSPYYYIYTSTVLTE